jgi:two-component system C4-dicarboxylate transport response regulator DctD
MPVILVTGHGDIPMAVKAIQDGVYDFITKPFATDRLVQSVRRAAEKRRLFWKTAPFARRRSRFATTCR